MKTITIETTDVMSSGHTHTGGYVLVVEVAGAKPGITLFQASDKVMIEFPDRATVAQLHAELEKMLAVWQHRVPEQVLKILNEAIDADPGAVRALFAVHVECNQKLADHPSIICTAEPAHVGLLGILNGLVYPLTGEKLCGCYDETGKLLRFGRFSGPEPKA